MLSSRRKLFWWASEGRPSEPSYFRQLSQRWRAFGRSRRRLIVPVAAMARRAGNGEQAVRPTYTVYWTDAAVSEAEFLANGQSVRSANYDELDDALGWARRVNNNIGIAWLISGYDGTRLTRSEIEKLVRKS
jgi:hypothetical protein